jgi:hypothetical protein
MKTLKLVMIMAIFAFSTITIAMAEHPSKINPTKGTINLTFEQAIQNPGLVMAMHDQLHPDFLSTKTNQQLYTVSVGYLNYNIRITGTYNQWNAFFKVTLPLANHSEIKF